MGLPLQGLRVIDLTQDFAGPFCTMILSDLGAEMINLPCPQCGLDFELVIQTHQ